MHFLLTLDTQGQRIPLIVVRKEGIQIGKEKSYSNVGTHKVILECEGSEAELASQTPTAKIILLNTGWV